LKEFLICKARVVTRMGDLLDEECDAIVCPSNPFNQMRGGVAAAIRMKGGDSVEKEAMEKAPLMIGSAVPTTAGNLRPRIRLVIHSPTVPEPVGQSNSTIVKRAMRSALICADQIGAHIVAFPGMGTGTGWLPYDEAARAMISEIVSYLNENPATGITEIRIIAHSEPFLSAIETAVEEHKARRKEGN
jgi:O-acetyl-ADP-ribose deacetylase (regulator of RNase III)